MAEFNNIEYKLTDSEKFALICGMLAGLRLQDKTIPPDQVVVTLKPIGVNGTGTIGIMAVDVQYTGVNKIKIPVNIATLCLLNKIATIVMPRHIYAENLI